MSEMATGIPIGMAIGIGSGIATGIASGQGMAKKAVAERIRDLALTHTITVQKPDGGYLTLDEFIALTTAPGGQPLQKRKKTALVITVLFGLLILAGGLLFFFLRLRL